MSNVTAPKPRPIGITILAVLAGIALLLAIIHLLQALAILPYFVGDIAIVDFSLWYALMWGLVIYFWVWVIRALLNLQQEGWLFLLIVSGFNLMLDFVTMISTPTTVTDLSISFVLNLVIFAYTLTPGTKRAFEMAE
jgi:hypothetical protein